MCTYVQYTVCTRTLHTKYYSNIRIFFFVSGWNALFLGANAVVDAMTEKYGAEKRDLLDPVNRQSTLLYLRTICTVVCMYSTW